jgi:hypothetical protein
MDENESTQACDWCGEQDEKIASSWNDRYGNPTWRGNPSGKSFMICKSCHWSAERDQEIDEINNIYNDLIG